MSDVRSSTRQLAGVHHVSALSAHIDRSHDLYTRVLGMRPVIRTVNQDQPSMYHLFFGDGAGSPGSDITVFDLPDAARERRGNNSIAPTHAFLTEALGLALDHDFTTADGSAHRVHVYRIGAGGAHAEVHVAERPDLPRARYGAGGVHHVALRVPDGQLMDPWAKHLTALGFSNSGIVDRHYFTSLYVREPSHVLFELATDGPGFTVDGPLDGERLSLPPLLEPRRAEIEARLKPLHVDPASLARRERSTTWS